MAASLTDLTVAFSIRLTATAKKALDLSTPQDALAYDYSKSFTFGNGALQANGLFHDNRTLASGVSEDIDLAGVLADAFGDTVTFANIKLLIIENTSTAASSILSVGGAVGTPFDTWLGGATEVLKIHPGESKVLICRTDADGYVCTGGADDLLKIANAAGDVATYKIIALGDSA